MANQVLIVTALAGFVRSFLNNDITILQSMGYDVHCAANKMHPGADGIEEYFIEKHIIFHQIDFSSNKPISMASWRAWRQLRELINNNSFRMVHSHTPIVGVLSRLLCAKKRKSGTKVVYTTHGFYFHKKSGKKSWIIYFTIERYMSKFTDIIITINMEDFKNAKRMYCSDVRRINGVGVDISRFTNIVIDKELYRKTIGVNKNDTMILAIGELSLRKNHQIVIKALGKLKQKNIVFVICGNEMSDSHTTNIIKALTDEYSVKTILLGLRKDIPQICHCADIGIISSTREGLGLAGIEMLASGLPVVASNVHGILDYMHDGENGFLCSPYDENEFAEGISKLLDSKIREKMRPYCIESVRLFDRKVAFLQMEEIYRDIIPDVGENS